MQPESHQTSISSGTLCISPPHSGHGNVTSSTNGRWRSSGGAAPSSDSSAREPTQWMCDPSPSQRHTGSGVPQ